MKLIPNLKGKDKYETLENYSILFIAIGAAMLSCGIGLSIISPKGIAAILGSIGSFIAFVATILLIFAWVSKEFKGG